MIVMIDNYDSFVYNLYQVIGSITPDITVFRNDEVTMDQIEQLQPTHIILSPGPGKPSEAGKMEEIIKHFYLQVPMLGICLGHQAIMEVFGTTIGYAKTVMHGKTSVLTVEQSDALFQGVTDWTVTRYHSLSGKRDTLSKELLVLAHSEDGEIMAVKHQQYPVYGLQFHPESILTKEGTQMIKNFLEVTTHD